MLQKMNHDQVLEFLMERLPGFQIDGKNTLNLEELRDLAESISEMDALSEGGVVGPRTPEEPPVEPKQRPGQEKMPKSKEGEMEAKSAGKNPGPESKPEVPGGFPIGDMAGMEMGGATGFKTGGAMGTGGATVANQPKLIVSNYVLSPAVPKAGQDFTLQLTFLNTNASHAVRNIKITLGGGEGAPSLPAQKPGETAGAQAAAGGGSVFTPVGSSNTFYISRINAKKTGEKKITLKTSPTVTAQNYPLTVSYEYEDTDGNQYQGSELIGIPVAQKAEILIGDLKTDPLATDGQLENRPVYLNMDLFNIGKDALSTFMVSIEGEGFNVTESSRYFIGNFAPGATDRYSVEITPRAEKVKGKIIITYEDSMGQKHKEEKPFEYTVMGFAEQGKVKREDLKAYEGNSKLLTDGNGNFFDAQTLQPVAPPADGLNPIIPIGIGVVILIALAFLICKVNRNRKNKKKELEIDAQ